MERVVIVGPGGAGKSTLARELGKRTGIPVIHLDHLFWKPGWIETPLEEFRDKQRTALAAAGERWIADGNYSGTAETRFPRADTILFLDFHPLRCLARVVRRTLRSHGRETQAPGCPDKLDWAFTKYLLAYRRNARPRMLRAIETYAPDARLVTLRSPRRVRRYLASGAGSA